MFYSQEKFPQTVRKGIDLRILIALALLLYFGSVVGYGLFIGDYREFWFQLLGVKAMSILFSDLDVIAAGCESLRQGFDPLVDNPNDIFGRPMNYPRIWQTLAYTGFSRAYTPYVGILLGVTFFALCLFYIGPIQQKDRSKFWMYLLVFCSPNVMLLIERANIDIVIMGLLVLATAFRERPYGLYFTLLIASILKLYPLFAAVAGFKKEIKKNIPLLLFILSLGIYLVLTWQDLALISKSTPRSNWFSYGMNVFLGDMSTRFPAQYAFLVGKILPIVLVICILFVVVFRALHESNHFKGLAVEKHGFGFLVGAAVYCGTFVIGNNFDYRLSFLLLTIPQLYDWALQEKGRGFHSFMLLSVLFMLWNNAFINYSRMIGLKKPMFLLEETISWILLYAFLLQGVKWMISEFSLTDYLPKKKEANT